MRELVVSAPAGAINLHLRRARPHLRRAGLRLAPLLSTATNKQSPANLFFTSSLALRLKIEKTTESSK